MQVEEYGRTDLVPEDEIAAGEPPPTLRERRRFFAVATIAMLATLGIILGVAFHYTGGRVVYVIDDAYIHLGMARNLVHHGTWGVTPGVYESASSSPGWTTLEAGLLAIVPPLGELLPLLLNLAAAIWILWLLSRAFGLPRLTKQTWPSWLVALILPTIALFLSVLPLVGMEALLQSALVLQALVLLPAVARHEASARTYRWYLVVLACAACVRFEALFVGAGFAIALVATGWKRASGWNVDAVRRRFGAAIGTALAVGIPTAILMVINRAFGQGLFPNSVIVKTLLSGKRGTIRPPGAFFDKLTQDPMVAALFLLALGYLVFAASGGRARYWPSVTAYAITVFLHVAFADVGYVERYEEYLLVMGLFLMLVIGREVVPDRAWQPALVWFALFLLVLSPSKIQYLPNAPIASSNQYRQQYQMGRFLKRYYNHQAVMLNDIGNVAWFHDGRIVDVVGLASHDILVARQDHRFTRRFLTAITAKYDVQAIVIYANTAYGQHPKNWITVGTWSLGQKKVSPLGSTVTFYAPSAKLAIRMWNDLHAFERELPHGVKVKYNEFLGALIPRLEASGASSPRT